MAKLLTQILTLVLCCHISHSVDQKLELPINPCPDSFEYLQNKDTYIGKITVRNSQFNQTVQIKLAQKEPLKTEYYGSLALFEDAETTINNLLNGLPVTYRVDFPESKLLPNLIEIRVNDLVICEEDATKINYPFTLINLEHTLGIRPRPIHSENDRKRRSTPDEYTQYLAEICGIENEPVANLITGGSFLQHGQSPWLAAIYLKSPTALRFHCVGTLISSRTVLTAAHCLQNTNSDEVIISLGRYNLSVFSEEGAENHDVQEINIHPDFNAKLYPDADIALLKISKSVSFNTHIRPVCLWNETADGDVTGLSGTISGWGSNEGDNKLSSVPRSAKAAIVSEAECIRSNAGFVQLTSNRTLCAGNRDGTGPCVGDSGTGLVIRHKNRWTLRGIQSVELTQNRRCDLNEFTVYCDVAKHLDWVISAMDI